MQTVFIIILVKWVYKVVMQRFEQRLMFQQIHFPPSYNVNDYVTHIYRKYMDLDENNLRNWVEATCVKLRCVINVINLVNPKTCREFS